MQHRMKTFDLVAPYTTVSTDGKVVQKGQVVTVSAEHLKDLKRLGFTEATTAKVPEATTTAKTTKRRKEWATCSANMLK